MSNDEGGFPGCFGGPRTQLGWGLEQIRPWGLELPNIFRSGRSDRRRKNAHYLNRNPQRGSKKHMEVDANGVHLRKEGGLLLFACW